MLKRLFTAFLTAVMTLSLCTAVIATDETSTETPEKVNIYEKWGDFEDEQYWDGVKFKFFSEGSIESSPVWLRKRRKYTNRF